MGKKKGTTKTKSRTRRATFVQGKKHLDLDALTVMPKSANVVQRTQLNDDAPSVGDATTVYFKAHDDEAAPSQYAVASTRLAAFLQMPKIISHNSFARAQGVNGIVSGAVPGSPFAETKYDREIVWPANTSKKEMESTARDAGYDERDGKYYGVSGQVTQWVNFKRPEFQKGLSDLQLFDAITGQKDRHGANIFIDPETGQVSGIDDDRSFGSGIAVSAQGTPSGKYTGLPALVDAGTAAEIIAADATKLFELLEPAVDDSKELTDREIKDAQLRLENVQRYLLGLQADGLLVQNWDNRTYDLAMRNPTTSYLGVQATALEEALEESKTNPSWVIVGAPQPDPTPPPGGMPVLPPPPPGNLPPLRRRGLGFTVPAPTNVPAPDPGLPTVTTRQLFSPRMQDASQAARFRLGAVREKPSGGAVLTARRASDLDVDDEVTTPSEDGNPPSD